MGDKSAMDVIAFDGTITAQEAKVCTFIVVFVTTKIMYYVIIPMNGKIKESIFLVSRSLDRCVSRNILSKRDHAKSRAYG